MVGAHECAWKVDSEAVEVLIDIEQGDSSEGDSGDVSTQGIAEMGYGGCRAAAGSGRREEYMCTCFILFYLLHALLPRDSFHDMNGLQ